MFDAITDHAFIQDAAPCERVDIQEFAWPQLGFSTDMLRLLGLSTHAQFHLLDSGCHWRQQSPGHSTNVSNTKYVFVKALNVTTMPDFDECMLEAGRPFVPNMQTHLAAERASRGKLRAGG